jgi:serine/threonine protein phosphatase PrpC
MEDRHTLRRGFTGSDAVTLLAVFDGHRGADVAEYASRCAA